MYCIDRWLIMIAQDDDDDDAAYVLHLLGMTCTLFRFLVHLLFFSLCMFLLFQFVFIQWCWCWWKFVLFTSLQFFCCGSVQFLYNGLCCFAVRTRWKWACWPGSTVDKPSLCWQDTYGVTSYHRRPTHAFVDDMTTNRPAVSTGCVLTCLMNWSTDWSRMIIIIIMIIAIVVIIIISELKQQCLQAAQEQNAQSLARVSCRW